MRFLFTFFSILFCFTLHAQELTVKSFSESKSDLSARTYPRMDNNDKPCALVKVQLASAGAVVEGSVIGKVEYKTSEYWVYMPRGSKRLTVKLEGYLPLPVEFNALESSTTYVLTISGVVNNGGQTQEVRTRTGWIILDSEPQGASVYINNEYVGNTPLDNYKQAYGTYSYRLEMPNYHNLDGTLELNASRYEKTFKLAPAFGSIAISGISGATVLLDGKQTGKTTPCTLTEVASGQHTITLQKAKYAPRQLTAQVQDGQTTSLTANLDARFAMLTINTLQGAQIYVDGTQMGTSKYTEGLMEGYHDIEARLAHHKTASRQVQVTAGQPQTITLNPTPIYGSLDVVSTPRNATITIDGKQVGQTPNTIDQLLEGEHSVTLSLNGYGSITKNVTIKDGQTATISETLQKNNIVLSPAGALTGPGFVAVDDDRIFDVVENNAQFPGGEDACYKWLSEQIMYPDSCQEHGIQGRVFVSFVVNTDGSVVEVKVMRSPDDNLSKEAERVVKLMPKWEPATRGKKPVRSRFNLPIMFRFKD